MRTLRAQRVDRVALTPQPHRPEPHALRKRPGVGEGADDGEGARVLGAERVERSDAQPAPFPLAAAQERVGDVGDARHGEQGADRGRPERDERGEHGPAVLRRFRSQCGTLANWDKSTMISRYWQGLTLWVTALLASGCAGAVPKGSYGVSSIEIAGTEHADAEAIAACLATHPRERFGVRLFGSDAPPCGEPPFEASGVPIALWAWPWTEWPIFSPPAFHRDLARVERFYRARGYYEARIVKSDVEPDEDARTVDVALVVEEGEPVLVVRIRIEGLERVPEDVVERIRDAIELELGGPFDEALYDRSKRSILRVLHEASYAKASVEGSVALDPEQKLARVLLRVEPGPPCTFGDVLVEGEGELARTAIVGAAAIGRGEPFRVSTLSDAQRAIYELGAFASVEIERHPRPDSAVVDVLIRVVPARPIRFGVGIGMESGGVHAFQDEVTGDSFAQWDVHLVGKVEHRNFLGGMRRLRIEERPRLIFDEPFPGTGSSSPGNLLLMELRQPAFFESRTTLVGRGRWDRGPDPFGGRFLRHDLVLGVGPERRFLGGTLLLSSTVNFDLFLPDDEGPFPSYDLAYLRHRAALDLRDDARRTRSGAYFSVVAMHAGYFLPSAWDLVRLTQESRGYLPLPFGVVLAARAKLGLMLIGESTIDVPPEPAMCDTSVAVDPLCTQWLFANNLARFGPLRHRLRGGGQNSVRGYAPNTLGDVEIVSDGQVDRLLSGGLRQWEGSLELRLPITMDFGTALFVDVGDVSQGTSWRFDHPQTSVGLGFRYHTLVGPLRLDAAVAPDSLQVAGTDERVRTESVTEPSAFGVGGLSLHFTIGESF